MTARGLAVLVASLLALGANACDRDSASKDGRLADRWSALRDQYGPPPTSGGGTVLEPPLTTAVVTPDEVTLSGNSVGRNPTVRAISEQLASDSAETAESAAARWVVWTTPSVRVQRLARLVEALRLAADEPTVHLAVEVSDEGSTDVRGVRLAPIERRKLSASNAWAAHAPERTTVSDFLETLRERRQPPEEDVELFTE